MMAPTYSTTDSFSNVITLFRNDERVTHVFRDHRISLHELEENGLGALYYLIAHDYGTGEKTFVWLKDKEEYDILKKEMNRDLNEANNFKKALASYKKESVGKQSVGKQSVGKQFVAAVKALHVQRFCDQWLAEQEAATDLKKAAQLVRDPSEEELRELCSPLNATTDPLKLKELEERFPGATMVLSLQPRQRVVKYVYEDLYEDSSINHMISCEGQPYAVQSFASIGCKGRPNLMAEWRGMYIDLTHLF
jgi:hypothetical protein